jgi:hypothetical protein
MEVPMNILLNKKEVQTLHKVDQFNKVVVVDLDLYQIRQEHMNRANN